MDPNDLTHLYNISDISVESMSIFDIRCHMRFVLLTRKGLIKNTFFLHCNSENTRGKKSHSVGGKQVQRNEKCTVIITHSRT